MPLTREGLITQYKQIHEQSDYGYTSKNLLYLLLPYIKELEAKTILDYGCGQSTLTDSIKGELEPSDIKTYKYDPAISEHCTLPEEKVDLVLCTDVLEHIPYADLEEVIKKILSLGEHAIFIISTKKAKQFLPDGSNAHCSVYKGSWWLDFIKQYTDFAKPIPWPVHSNCAIITWDSRAVGGMLDCAIKYIAGNADKFFKK